MTPEIQDEPSVNLWRLVDDRLKGRWWMALALAAALGLGAGLALYRTSTPEYRATGLVRIHPQLTPVLRETAETRNLPMYDTYKRTYAALLTESQTLAAALEDPELAPFLDGLEEAPLEWIRDGLSVDSERATELVRVHFNDPSRRMAHAAVNAVLEAFESVHAETPTRQLAAARDVLVAEQQQARTERTDLQRRIDELAARFEFGAAAFEEGLRMRLDRLADREGELAEIRSVLAARRGDIEGEGSAAPALDPSDADLERLEPALTGLRQVRDELRSRVAVARERWTPENRMRQRLERELGVAESMYEETEARARERWASLDPVDLEGAAAAALDDATLERRAADLEQRLEDDRAWIRQASTARRESMNLNAEVEVVEERIAAIDTRINELQREVLDRDGGALQGRFTVVPAVMPTVPDQDRRKKLAAAGLVAGAGLGFGLVFLLGTVDRRAYGTAQIETIGRLACLGVLPNLPDRASPDDEEVAAHCVHQVRNRIDALRRGEGPLVLAVTSPYQGDGKTSLAVALAWSYARAGARTLMVDCDLVGEGLSEQTGVLGRPGLREVVAGEADFEDLAVPLDGAPLAVLPAGVRDDVGAEALRRETIDRLLDRVRGERDVVIVDCGPAPGSLETVPVIAAADATLLVVMRGRSQSRLDSTVDLVESVGGRLIGMVLNCAGAGECERYVSASAVSARRADGAARTRRTPVEAARDRGALVRTMTPRKREGEAA